MNDWQNVNANLIITDPPFGIGFNGKQTNYHRNVNNVVDGYVEWSLSEYGIIRMYQEKFKGKWTSINIFWLAK